MRAELFHHQNSALLVGHPKETPEVSQKTDSFILNKKQILKTKKKTTSAFCLFSSCFKCFYLFSALWGL